MTKSEIFSLAHKIVRYKDTHKLGNNIFRFIPSGSSYRYKFSKALRYIYKKMLSETNNNRGKVSPAISNTPTLKQWDFLQRMRAETEAKNFSEFCKKYTKKTASRLISWNVEKRQDGYRF